MIVTLRAALLTVLVATATPQLVEGQEATSDKLPQRIELLERKVSDLEQRIRDLEAIITAEPSRARPMPASANWRELANWRQLRRGMAIDQVRALLGEPDRVETMGSFTTWRWGESGEASLQFYQDGLYSWSEPRR